MTRKEIHRKYTVESGTIQSLGKFEGERIYVAYFWDIFLDGFADADDKNIIAFVITSEDIAEFPELSSDGYKAGDRLCLHVRDGGFVVCEDIQPV